MEILILEDDHERIKKFKHFYGLPVEVTTKADECIEQIKSLQFIDVLWLDHDLGGEVFVNSAEKNTGMEVVRFLVWNENLVNKIKVINVHSLNEPAAKEMTTKLKEAGYNVKRAPFHLLNFNKSR